MTILETLGEAQLLRAEGDRLLASAVAQRIGRMARRLGRSIAARWYHVVGMTARETQFHLESGSHATARKGNHGGGA